MTADLQLVSLRRLLWQSPATPSQKATVPQLTASDRGSGGVVKELATESFTILQWVVNNIKWTCVFSFFSSLFWGGGGGGYLGGLRSIRIRYVKFLNNQWRYCIGKRKIHNATRMLETANDYIGSYISVLGRQHSSQRISSPLRRLQFWGLDDSAVRISWRRKDGEFLSRDEEVGRTQRD